MVIFCSDSDGYSMIGNCYCFTGANIDGTGTVFMSSILNDATGAPDTTMGGFVASWPDKDTILGYSVSAGEALKGDEIPEVSCCSLVKIMWILITPSGILLGSSYRYFYLGTGTVQSRVVL